MLALASLLLAVSSFSVAGQSPAADALAPVPPAPALYVLDEPGLLAKREREALETLLIEHDRAAGERILLGIFGGAGDEDPQARTKRVLETWLTDAGYSNGALLAIYVRERRAVLLPAYGLESLDESQARAIARDFVAPELAAGHPYRAAGLGLLELLRTIESPLVASGRAEQILYEGGLQGGLSPARRGAGLLLWLVFALLGIGSLGVALNAVLAAEAHFTGEGWYRPNPLKALSLGSLRQLLRRPDAGGTGGADGRW